MIAAFMQHLEEAKKDPALNAELLGTVGTLLSQAYSIDLKNPATLERYPTNGLALPDVFIAGRNALLRNQASNGGVAERTTETKSEDDVAFEKFVKRLKRTTNFFGDTEDGSEEYLRRLERARAKFNERRKEKKSENAPPMPETPPAPKAEVSAEVKQEADAIKLEGNAHLKAGDFDKAVECYTRCIQLDGSNAVYYGNRAAAKMHLKQYSSAVDDSKMAISINSKYARAHERLASCYRSLGMDDLELETLQNAVTEHPGNEQLAQLLSDAQGRKAAATREPGGADDLPGFPGTMPSPEQMSTMAESMGLNISPEMVQNFMSSPMGAQVQSALRGDNPAMAAMMQQGMQAMMNNPQAAQEQLKSMMGGGSNVPGTGGDGDEGAQN